MVYASPTMHVTRFRSKNTLQWTMALVLVCAAYTWPRALDAQQRPAARAGDQGALDTVQIRDNRLLIFGAGGNVTVHVGEDGLMLVDSGSEPTAEETAEALTGITKFPRRQ